MVRSLFITAILLIPGINVCFGQNDWKQGYIIKNEGDTVYGFIDNRDSNGSGKECFFKKDLNSETQTFTPQELFGYRFIDGIYFVKKTIDDPGISGPLFLEFLIDGQLNVYHLRDYNDRYFIETNGELVELKNTETVQKINSVDYLRENKEYVRTLTFLLRDAGIQADIEKSKFEAKSLVHIAKEYHEKVCFDRQCIIYAWKKKPVHLKKGAFAGLVFSRMNFGKSFVSNFSTGSTFGLRFEIENLAAWAEKITFGWDLGFESFSNYTFTTDKSYNNFITYEGKDYNLTTNEAYWRRPVVQSLDVNIKTLAFSLPVSVKYYLSKGNTQPYLSLGFQNLFILSQNKEFTYERFHDEFNKTIPFYHAGVVIKGGSSFRLDDKHSFEAELGFQSTQNSNINQLLKLSNTVISIEVGYNF